MASKTNKLLINASEFPFTYAHTVRSSLENSDLAPRMPGIFFGDKANADFGSPQLVYAENVLPFAEGIFSVGFAEQAVAIPAGVTTCDQAITLRNELEEVWVHVPAAGANWVYTPATATWASVDPFTFTGSLVTRAYVNGRTFVCYEQDRILEYNTTTGVFDNAAIVFPPGTLISDIRGIGGAANYLILYTDLDILWGSPLDFLDFSDNDAGAGQQTPIDIKGQIVAVLPISGGFIAYTTRNAIGATYTYDDISPFIFKEIVACGGIQSAENVTVDANEVGQYIWGTNGLQLVNLTGAIAVHPAVTDFLVGQEIESWNPATKRVDLVTGSSAMTVKIAFLAGRYLVISYGQGTTDFEFALVYDESLKRWGKLRIDHVDAFMFPYPAGTGALNYDDLVGNYNDLVVDYATLGILFLTVIPAKKGIAFLKTNGQIMTLESHFNQTTAEGVAVFGHIADRHDRMVTIHSMEIDGLRTGVTPEVTILSSADGLDRDANTTMVADKVAGKYSRYRCRTTSRNHDVAVEGSFVISTILLDVIRHGYR